MKEEILANLARTVKEFDTAGAESWARKAMEGGIEPLEALDALTEAIREVGNAFESGDCFLPELVGAAEAMLAAMPVVKDVIKASGQTRESAGKVVAGTVSGDIHTIGKMMLCTLLTADGFEVIDLGIDVPRQKFVDTVRQEKPDILAMSALLTITAREMHNVIEELEAEGLRGGLTIIVGGGAISDHFAEKIGADGYDATAPGGVKLARKLLEG